MRFFVAMLWVTCAAGCTVSLSSLEGRRCDKARPCLAGYACSTEGVCLLARDGGVIGRNDSGIVGVGPRGLCSVDGWCFAAPVPQGEDLRDLRVRGDAVTPDVVAVGVGGVILRGDGGWSRDATDTLETLNGLYAASDQTLWAVGNHGVILHDSGDGSWVRVDAGTVQNLNAVFGTEDHPLVVGAGGTVLRWSGRGFTHLDAGVATAFLGGFSLSATRAWIVGAEGTVDFTDGTLITEGKVGLTEIYQSMSGTSATDLWVVGNAGAVTHWDGTVWTTQDAGTTANLNRVLALPSQVFIAGDRGTLLQRSASGFSQSDGLGAGLGVGAGNLYALAAGGPNNVWLAGAAGLLESFDGNAWAPRSLQNPETLTSLWGAGPTDFWVTGSTLGTLEHFDGSAWTHFTVPGLGIPGTGPTAVWGSGQGDLWSVTADGQFLFFDGAAWQRFEVANTTPLHALSGSAPDNIWAVGDQGTVFHNDGTGWAASTLAAPTTSLLDVLSLSSGDAWTVGSGGAAFHFDGQTWAAADAGSGVQLNGLWGLSAADVWAVGKNVIEHYDGAQWSVAGDARGYTLRRIYGNDDTDLYAISAEGEILHGNGTTWTVQSAGTHGIALNGIFGFGAGQVFVVGNNGVILQQLGP